MKINDIVIFKKSNSKAKIIGENEKNFFINFLNDQGEVVQPAHPFEFSKDSFIPDNRLISKHISEIEVGDTLISLGTYDLEANSLSIVITDDWGYENHGTIDLSLNDAKRLKRKLEEAIKVMKINNEIMGGKNNAI